MDNYATDPVTSIQENVILIGSPALGSMPHAPAEVDETVRPFTTTGCTVYVKRFDYDEGMDVEDEQTTTGGDPLAGEEFAPGADDDTSGGTGGDDSEESFTAYSCAPTRFTWTAIPGVTIVGREMSGSYGLTLGGTGAARAYLLPWVADGITWMHLDFGCGYFFTDTMNGCTLAIGGPVQAPVVAHSNVGRTSAVAERTPGQFEFMLGKLGTNPIWTVLDKTAYMSNSEREGRTEEGYPARVGTQVNVIGFNRGLTETSGWEFWAQAYMLYRDEGGRSLVRDIEVAKIFPRD